MTTRSDGFLRWVLPAMFAMVALSALLSGRDLSQAFLQLASDAEQVRGPIETWAQRMVSLLLVAAAAERIFAHVARRRELPSLTLALVFVLYWIGNVALPAFFGAHPQVSHEYLYTLVLGLACVLVTSSERDGLLDAARGALFLFIAAGLVLIPVMPAMVIDVTYNQGLIAGLPRFGGLAPHPVAMGMFAQIALLLLWARPFRRRWLTVLAWIIGGAALFLAQSKTAWIGFVLCGICLFAVRNGASLWRRISDPRNGLLGVFVCVLAGTVLLAVLGWVLVGDLEAQVSDFADTAQGAQLISMTGRDHIWAVATEEWRASPVFGYGPGLWDAGFRRSIGIPNATNAHNQLMDTLARCGTVGAVALIAYAVVLLVMSVRYAKASGGLSLALFVALALLSISEVPLLLFGYGTELFAHLLLLITLSAAASAGAHAHVARTPYAWGVTT